MFFFRKAVSSGFRARGTISPHRFLAVKNNFVKTTFFTAPIYTYFEGRVRVEITRSIGQNLPKVPKNVVFGRFFFQNYAK